MNGDTHSIIMRLNAIKEDLCDDSKIVIAIDGPDRVGKSTLIKDVKELLEDMNITVRTHSQPAHPYFRERIIHNKNITELERILLLIQDGQMVADRIYNSRYNVHILDRSVLSSMPIYNLPHVIEPGEREIVANLFLHGLTHLYEPNVTIHLCCEPFEEDDTFVASRSTHNKTLEMYKHMAQGFDSMFDAINSMYRTYISSRNDDQLHSPFLEYIPAPFMIDNTDRANRIISTLDSIRAVQ